MRTLSLCLTWNWVKSDTDKIVTVEQLTLNFNCALSFNHMSYIHYKQLSTVKSLLFHYSFVSIWTIIQLFHGFKSTINLS